MSQINLYFPTPIYTHEDIFNKEQNDLWSNKILELQETIPSGGTTWEGNTYTTHGTFDLLDDSTFSPLINIIAAKSTTRLFIFAMSTASRGKPKLRQQAQVGK